jgi:hypothetical protein
MAGRLSSLVSRFTGGKSQGSGGWLDFEDLDPAAPEDVASAATDVKSQLSPFAARLNPAEGIVPDSTGKVAYQPPAVEDPSIWRQGAEQAQLAHMVRGFTGMVPLDSYNVKHGARAGMVAENPAMDAVESAAMNPWHEEQMRVKNANTTHAYINQYAKMQQDMDNESNRNAVQTAREMAIGAGYHKMFEENLQFQRDNMERQNKILDKHLEHTEFQENNATKRLAIQEASAAKRFEPKEPEIISHEMTKTLDGMLNDIVKLVQDPETGMGITDGVLTLGDHRVASSPKANQLRRLIDGAHQYLIQLDRRQMTKQGGSLYRGMLPYFGDSWDSNDLSKQDMVKFDIDNLKTLLHNTRGIRAALYQRGNNPITGTNFYDEADATGRNLFKDVQSGVFKTEDDSPEQVDFHQKDAKAPIDATDDDVRAAMKALGIEP